MTVTFSVQPDVITFAIEVRFVVHQRVAVGGPLVAPAMAGLRLAVLGMKIQSVGRERLRIGAVIDVVVEAVDRLLTLIGNCDARVLPEWHGEETIQRLDASYRKHFRVPVEVIS